MLVTWLQRHRYSLLFLLAVLVMGGMFAAFKLPVTLFPTTQFPRILVNIDSGDRPVDRTVIEVTLPLEQALRTVPSVRDIRSISSRGSVDISINLNWGSNMVTALLQVQSAINQAIPSLPPGTVFNAERMDPTVFPVFGLSLTSPSHSLVELRDFAYFQLRPLLSAIPGIARVEILGGKQTEIQVLVDPAKLRASGLTLESVAKALAANNVITAVGRIEDYYRLYLISSDTRLRSVDDIRHTILHTGTNGIVELDDVAEIQLGEVPQWTRVTANGYDAVLVNVIQQADANTVAIAHEINKQLAGFQRQIPKDVSIKPYYDQSQLVVAAALSVRDAILIGAALAAVVLLLFLRNLRMTLIVAITLPCVLATTILLLKVFHMSFNIMTLGGMAAAVGLIIDDGVVMLEHIMRRLSQDQQGKTLYGPVMSAAMEMLRPLMGSSLATIVIFLPLAFITGVTGSFFQALALTMAASLVISFLFAFLAVPLLGEMLLKQADAVHLERIGPFLNRFNLAYLKLMNTFLQTPAWPMIIVALMMVMGFIAYTQTGSGFMPHMDEGGFILDYTAPPGTSLTETDRLLQQVEKLISAMPEVDNYSRRTGLQLGGGLTEPNTGDFFIRLKPQPRRSVDIIMDKLREQITKNVPGLTVETAQLMEDIIGDLTAVPQPIEVKIFSNNSDLLQQTANKIAKSLETIPGVVEIKNGIVISGDGINIQVDRVKASLLGLDPETVTRQIQNQLMGNVVSQIQTGEKLIGIRVFTPEDLHNRILQLQNLSLLNLKGQYVSLRRVATITIEEGQTEITRENLKPMVAVKARIEGRDMGSTMSDVKKVIKNILLPPGTYVEYGGLYQQQQKSFYDLVTVFFSAVLLVTILLLFMYENFRIVLSILIVTLLSICGVFLGLWLTGTELNISAMMGVTMIIGIVTETAIFYFAELTSHQQHSKKELINTGIVRLRPILMTSIIAILALMPLALGVGTGSAMQTPLAIAIISGLIFSLPLVLILMPALYLLLSPKPTL